MAQQTKSRPKTTAGSRSRSTTAKRSSSTTARARNGSGPKNAITEMAKKAKVPAIAAGAGLAGLAGGAALGRRSSASQTVGKRLGEVAKSVGSLSEGVGSFAAEVRRVREGLAVAGEGRSRSPIEVVLQGLTSRRGPSEP